MKIVELARAARALPLLALLVMACGLSGQAVMAQETSSSIRGQVVSVDGNPVAGAEVSIRHVPSGTVARSETGGTGQFFASGLRVGGPYEIRVTSADYQTVVRDGVFLQPGSQNPLAISVESPGETTDVVTVTAQRFALGDLNNGVGSSFSAQDIAEQPAIDRDVIKTLLRDPLAQSDGEGQLSVAGVNPRFNTFSIDGATQTDNFGLSDGTYATSRSPINLDAVESATLAVADYSVLASDFVGGSVNVVTKSGTNEFDGSVFYAYKDDSFVGDKFGDGFNGADFDAGDFEEKEYGFTLGGPIIKDKLFFFVSYDEYENAAPVDFTNFDEQNGIQPGFFDAVGISSSSPTASIRAPAPMWRMSPKRPSARWSSLTGTSISTTAFRSLTRTPKNPMSASAPTSSPRPGTTRRWKSRPTPPSFSRTGPTISRPTCASTTPPCPAARPVVPVPASARFLWISKTISRATSRARRWKAC